MKNLLLCLLAVLLSVSMVSCDEPKVIAPELPEAPAYIDDFKFYSKDEVLFEESFDTAESAEKFCPQHAGDSKDAHDSFVNTFKSCGEVGCIYGNSAWRSFEQIDSSKTYTLEYKIRLDSSYNLKAVDNKNVSVLTFNYGECGTWVSEFISFVSKEDGLYVYDGASGTLDECNYKLEADAWYTIKTTFTPIEEGKTEMKTSIEIDGVDKAINTKTFNNQNKYYWDIYFPAPVK